MDIETFVLGLVYTWGLQVERAAANQRCKYLAEESSQFLKGSKPGENSNVQKPILILK